MGSKVQTITNTNIETTNLGADEIQGDFIVSDGGDITLTDQGSVEAALAFASETLVAGNRNFNTLAEVVSGNLISPVTESNEGFFDKLDPTTVILAAAGIIGLVVLSRG